MASFAQELLAIERERVSPRAGLLARVVLSAFVAAIALVGQVAMAAAIGAICGQSDRT